MFSLRRSCITESCSPERIVVKNIATWRLALFAAIVLVALAGCAQLRSYKEPTEGSRARVRIVGNQPLLYSHKTCDRDDMKLEGFAYFGSKRHDLDMPYPPSEASDAGVPRLQ